MADEPIGVDDRRLDDAALEALAEDLAVAPPPALRSRVLREAERERALERGRRRERIWRGAALAAAAAGLGLALLWLGERSESDRLGHLLAGLEARHTELTERLAQVEDRLAEVRGVLSAQADVMRVLAEPALRTADLVPQTDAPGRGRVLLDPARGELALVVAELAPPEPGRIYELWAVRGDAAPEPAGLFAPSEARAFATRLVALPRPAEITAFAVSIEPEGGSASPTGPVILIGVVGEAQGGT